MGCYGPERHSTVPGQPPRAVSGWGFLFLCRIIYQNVGGQGKRILHTFIVCIVTLTWLFNFFSPDILTAKLCLPIAFGFQSNYPHLCSI